MEIERFDFWSKALPVGVPTTLGLRVRKEHGLTHVDMFALDENQGQRTSDNLWGIAEQIVENVLPDEDIESIQWTFNVDIRSTKLKFLKFQGKPFKLEMSDFNAIEFESMHFNRASIKKYNEKLQHRSLESFNLPSVPEQKKSVFCIPSQHGDAKNGIVYCVPPTYNPSPSGYVFLGNEFLLVDAKKIIDLFRRSDPKMIGHTVDRAMLMESPRMQAAKSSLEYPIDTGGWAYDKEKGICPCSGWAGTIHLIEHFNLPYFPIKIEGGGRDHLLDLVGYQVEGRPFQLVKLDYI